MHDDRQLTEGRFERFLRDVIRPQVYPAVLPLDLSSWQAPGEPVPFAEAARQDYTPLAPGSSWGAAWGTTWIRVRGTVPRVWQDTAREGRLALEVLVDLGFHDRAPGFQCEGLVHSADGEVIKAVSPFNQHVPLELLELAADGSVDFYIEAASNPDLSQSWSFDPTPLGDRRTAGTDPRYTLGMIGIAQRDTELWELAQDCRVLGQLMMELPAELPRRHTILRALERMMDTLDPDDVVGTVPAARACLADVLASPAQASAHSLVATGHAHIDSAWLWPVRETVRKCARTFSNVLALMDANPAFVFSCSSAQQFAWIKESYPGLYARIREKVASGQFVPVGGMWVESDTNMPGSEAMARQFIEGKGFFLEEFGVECQEAWLPDSFGYSAALPQIVRAAGCRWFLTQKISWNQVNRMPHHTFHWEGLDGSRVFTHFPPVDSYNTDLAAKDLAHAERNFREHGKTGLSLVPFGYGDGGGGPTREMLATARRTADLEGSPRVRLGSARDFFEAAEAEYAQPPVWVGEMYLELHRGTYTSQSNTKKGNRRSEHLLREAELWSTTAAVRVPGFVYPFAELKRLWRLVLLQQFHDILPGSSIAWVHQDAERNYAAIARELEELITRAAEALLGEGDTEYLLNAAPHARLGVPALGATEVVAVQDRVAVRRLEGGSVLLENGLISARIDGSGHLVSLRDAVTGREAIAPGAKGNLLELHRDTPVHWDAWDIDEYYRRNVTVLDDVREFRVEDDGGGCAAVVISRGFGGSSVTQRVTLEAGSPSLSLETEVDWQESRKLLKLGFPLDLRADRSASETQFGHVFRPTTTNTSWEAAKFEICAHRWIHVSEPDYGVAVSNSASYGHEVVRVVRPDCGTTTTVRISLLRAPTFPDPQTDRGRHAFTVTVRPGAGIAEAVEEGYRTNLVPRRVTGGRGVEPLVELSSGGVLVEAVKLAEDGSGDVVVRLYESLGRRATAQFKPGFAVISVTETDLLERPLAEAPGALSGTWQDGDAEATLNLRPFQIVTLRLVRR